MSFYNLIQEKFFSTYEEWHMKSPLSNSGGFHIVGIDNSINAIRDGYIRYMEIYPPRPISGCTKMRSEIGNKEGYIDIYLDLDDKKYWMPDVSYDDAIKIMRAFVKKKLIPSKDKYTEAPKVDKEAVTKLFYDLARLLLGDYPETQKFINSLKLEGPEDIDMAWEKLYEEILLRKRAFEFDWKARKDDFIPILKELIVNNGINIDLGKLDELDKKVLNEDEDIPRWAAQINSVLEEHILAGMDVGSDSYVVLVLTKADFEKADTLARKLMQRIALLEKM